MLSGSISRGSCKVEKMKLKWCPACCYIRTFVHAFKRLGAVVGKVSVDLPGLAPVKRLFHVHGRWPEGLEGDDDVGDVELGLQVELDRGVLLTVVCLEQRSAGEDAKIDYWQFFTQTQTQILLVYHNFVSCSHQYYLRKGVISLCLELRALMDVKSSQYKSESTQTHCCWLQFVMAIGNTTVNQRILF